MNKATLGQGDPLTREQLVDVELDHIASVMPRALRDHSTAGLMDWNYWTRRLDQLVESGCFTRLQRARVDHLRLELVLLALDECALSDKDAEASSAAPRPGFTLMQARPFSTDLH